jgi:hypothetical protein
VTPRAVRRAERGVHLIWGLVLALFVYGLLPPWGESIVRFVVVPGLVGSGFAMWFAAPLRRLAKRVAGSGRKPLTRSRPELGQPAHPGLTRPDS